MMMLRDARTLLMVGALIGTMSQSLMAVQWTAESGAFTESGNWQGGSMPDPNEEALINNGGTAIVSGDDAVEIRSLRLGRGDGTGTYQQDGGLLISTGAFIGDDSIGVADISGGEFMIGDDSIHVGWRPGGEGTMNISGADTLVVSADDFQLGREGTGTLNFEGGQLRAGFTVIGKFGTGVWNQQGGLFDQDFGDIEIGDGGRDDQASTSGPRFGTLNLTGDGIIQTAGHFAIGNRRGGGEVNINGGILAVTGSGDSTLYIGRGNDSSPGVGLPTSLRIQGGDATIVVNGDISMNPVDVSETSTLIAELTGTEHSTIFVGGNADVANGTLIVELNGYVPKANDSWLLVQAGADTDALVEEIDNVVDSFGYDPLTHEFPELLGEVIGPFADVDTSQAVLTPGLEWDITYTEEEILLSVIGDATLLGDFNGDGVLDAMDINDLSLQVREDSMNLAYDVNADGLVDNSDREFWVNDLKNTYMGDANLDGEFNSTDFVAVFTAGQYEDGVAGNSGWETGDWNGDADFDSSDFVTAFQAGGYELGPRGAVQAVPEPSTVTSVALALLSFPWVRRWSRRAATR